MAVAQHIAKAGKAIAKVGGRKIPSQKRIFLCDWQMTLIRPGKPVPSNTAVFRVPLVMTKFDIKNYLQKIYNVEVFKVNTTITQGKRKKYAYIRGVYDKEPDYKKAYVILANGIFRFPKIFPSPRSKNNEASEA
ncbi:39S ribosomal protein L23, mitochondrial [Trichoplax sp. H2]|nr:39S ribosomal protein L23, mitochondrial [Trichoplax sp. H2]|eukprot:RDD43751.1 39S ribosomal protein L23, mitochondrial [Trichoplax sp. H2]